METTALAHLNKIELTAQALEAVKTDGMDNKQALIVMGATMEVLKTFVPEYSGLEYTEEGFKEAAKKVKEFFAKMMRRLRDMIRKLQIKFSAWLAKDREEANKMVPALKELIKSDKIKDSKTMEFFDFFNAFVMRIALDQGGFKVLPLDVIQKWRAGTINDLVNDMDESLKVFSFPAARLRLKTKDRLVILTVDSDGTRIGFVKEDDNGKLYIYKTGLYGLSGLMFIVSTLSVKSMLEAVTVYLEKAGVPDVKKLANEAVKALDEVEKVVDGYTKSDKVDEKTLALIKSRYAQYGYIVTLASRRTSVEYRAAVRLGRKYLNYKPKK